MNKTKRILTISCASLLLLSCAPSGGNGDSSVSSSAPSLWGEQTEALLKTYCGEVLPYPSGVSGKLTATEAALTDGTKYLEIKDESASFTFRNYYTALVDNGWSVVNGYQEGEIREAGDIDYVELTKTVGNVGYDITYYYKSASKSDATYGNVISCYNNLSPELAEATSWSENERYLMLDALTEELPFLALGKDYKASESDSDTFLLTDSSTLDKRKEYSDLLVEKGGFALNETLSVANDLYYLTKTMKDGSLIIATLDYSGGNYFNFRYKTSVHKSNSWPSSALSDIEKTLGITIPKFEASGSYTYYAKNGVVTIYAKTKSDFDTAAYEQELAAIGLIDYSGYGQMSNWEETLSLNCGVVSDGSNEYYEIVVALMVPTSTYSTTWPEKAISDFYKKMGVSVSLGSPTFASLEKPLKYTVFNDYDALYKEVYDYIIEYADLYGVDVSNANEVAAAVEKKVKEELGVDVTFYDQSKGAYNAVDSYFYNLAYHKEVDKDTGVITYEDATGKAAVRIERSVRGITTVHVGLGSGQTHSPVFAFDSATHVFGIGTTTTLGIEVDMLPYDITYTLNDSTGKVSLEGNVVTIASDAPIGSKFTVTASMDVPGSGKKTAVTEITIAERSEYNYKTAMDAVVSLFNSYLRSNLPSDETVLQTLESDEGDGAYYYVLYNFFDMTTFTGEGVKSIVKSNLIPEGFTLASDWEETKSSHDMPEYICYYTADNVTLEYTVHYNPAAYMVEIFSYPELLK